MRLAKVGNRKHRALAEEVQAELQAAKACLLPALRRITDPTTAALLAEVSHHLVSAIGFDDEILTLINQGDADELTKLVEELDERNQEYAEHLAAMERKVEALAREVAELRQQPQVHRRQVAASRERES